MEHISVHEIFRHIKYRLFSHVYHRNNYSWCQQTLEKVEGAIRNGYPEILATLGTKKNKKKHNTTQKAEKNSKKTDPTKILC